MTTYWLSDFCSLVNSLNINPFTGEDKNFRYNSLTRLIILLTLVGAIYYSKNSVQIFIAGGISIFLSVVIYFLTYNSSELSFIQDNEYNRDESMEQIKNKIDDLLKSTPPTKSAKDKIVNNENHITLAYTPPDTDKKKHIYFLEGNKMPSKVVTTQRDSSNYLSTGKQTPVGVVKQLRSLIKKNLSFS
tara:strand:+ start:2828 stop:3391 length:564 start_codon:yes stop_codon:yes gene_type:complete